VLDGVVAELAAVDVAAEDDDEVVAAPWVDVVAAVAGPAVAASTPPVTPAPSPPAMIAVITSRRARALVLETIRLLLSGRADRRLVLCHEAACATCLLPDRTRLLRPV
jgi:hypothetical protein